jgi:ribosome-associated heat shock protein Hsp15
MSATDPDQKTRLDKWLWAARFFKTRSSAADAVAGGKVHVNGARAKPARTIGPGDQLRIRRDNVEFDIVVRAVSERRGPAAQAQLLYEETEASRRQREEMAAQKRLARAFGIVDQGRPDKKGRRELMRIKKTY